MKKDLCLLTILLFLCISHLHAEDRYRLWLRYDKITDKYLLAGYKTQIKNIFSEGNSPSLSAAKEELSNGLSGLLDTKIPLVSSIQEHSIIMGTPANYHHSIVEVKRKLYLFYHDTQLSGKTHLRNVKVTELVYNADGTIKPITAYE